LFIYPAKKQSQPVKNKAEYKIPITFLWEQLCLFNQRVVFFSLNARTELVKGNKGHKKQKEE